MTAPSPDLFPITNLGKSSKTATLVPAPGLAE